MSMYRKKIIALLVVAVVYLLILLKTDSEGQSSTETIRHDVGIAASIESYKSEKSPNYIKPLALDRHSDAKFDNQNDLPEMAPKRVSESVTSQNYGSTCTPANDIVYIKVHKTASSTLQNIFYRFGDEKDLTFMLPVRDYYIEGVEKFKPSGLLKPPPGKHYNILANHARFFYEDFKKVMPADTKYVTLIREAASHFSSQYSYRVLKRQYKVELDEFSRNPKLYFEKYDLNKKGRFSGRDPELYDLGLNKKDMYDPIKVDNYIKFLDEKMDLVLLTEFFQESVILLKDLMCWDLQTIVHLNSKIRVPLGKEKGAKTSQTNSTKADALTDRLNEWNAGDYKMYDHFNRTLWKKVEAYGRERMAREIAELNVLTQRYEAECMSGTKIRDISYWSGPIGLKEYVLKKEKEHNMTCKRLGMSEPEFVAHLRKKQKTRLQG
ncbi:galactosylceramide sulfotransferase-like [Lytechinus pictus]|uniref:galactosylceramide sulfotransferase-like n=1 Tax=Lytechinus pictus TaxID=7653 RepID=UPI00240DD33E|nr:galactosylceramide sulfotransferase-like [Lytechinus pictus]